MNQRPYRMFLNELRGKKKVATLKDGSTATLTHVVGNEIIVGTHDVNGCTLYWGETGYVCSYCDSPTDIISWKDWEAVKEVSPWYEIINLCKNNNSYVGVKCKNSGQDLGTWRIDYFNIEAKLFVLSQVAWKQVALVVNEVVSDLYEFEEIKE